MSIYTVRRCAAPIRLTGGSSRAVLCLHGFTGYPGEMAYPARRLFDAGWDVAVPRLSGHGTCGEDFTAVHVDDWRRQAADEWMNMCTLYRDVRLLAHSMGGLLALDLAERFPVPSLALLAPIIGIRRPGMAWLPLLALIRGQIPVKWSPDPEYVFFDERDDDDDEFLGREYWSRRWLKHSSDVMKLQRRVEPRLHTIQGSVLGIYGAEDRIIRGIGRELLARKLGGNYHSLEIPECGHYIPYDKKPGNKEAAMDAVLAHFGGSE